MGSRHNEFSMQLCKMSFWGSNINFLKINRNEKNTKVFGKAIARAVSTSPKKKMGCSFSFMRGLSTNILNQKKKKLKQILQSYAPVMAASP